MSRKIGVPVWSTDYQPASHIHIHRETVSASNSSQAGSGTVTGQNRRRGLHGYGALPLAAAGYQQTNTAVHRRC
jgi:hypothetical protein